MVPGRVTPLNMGILLWLQLPWERARALRLLNLQTRLELVAAERANTSVRSPFDVPWDPESLAGLRWMQRAGTNSSELLYVLRGQLNLTPFSYTWEGVDRGHGRERWFPTLAERVQAVEAMLGATRLVLALEAWKLEHGRLPKRLDELVGHGLDRLPVDPYSTSGESFRYLPAGLDMPLRSVGTLGGWATVGTIPADTPLVWSMGPNVRKVSLPPTEGRREQYEIRDGPGFGWHLPRSDFDAWESGWPCPIP